MFSLSIDLLMVCNFFSIFSPITLISVFKTYSSMVLFGTAVKRLVICFVFGFVEFESVLAALLSGGVLVFRIDLWSLSLPLP